jgi:hypothetical protein
VGSAFFVKTYTFVFQLLKPQGLFLFPSMEKEAAEQSETMSTRNSILQIKSTISLLNNFMGDHH